MGKISVSFTCYKSLKRKIIQHISRNDLKVGTFLEEAVQKLHDRGAGVIVRQQVERLQKRRITTLGRKLVVVSNQISVEKEKLLAAWCREMGVRKNRALYFAVEQLLYEAASPGTAIWPDEALNPSFQVEDPRAELSGYVEQCARLKKRGKAFYEVPVETPIFLDYTILLFAMMASRAGSNVPFDSFSYGLVRDCLIGRRRGFTSVGQLEALGRWLLDSWVESSGTVERHREDVARRIKHLIEGKLAVIRPKEEDLHGGLFWVARVGVDLSLAADVTAMKRIVGLDFTVATAREDYQSMEVALAVARP